MEPQQIIAGMVFAGCSGAFAYLSEKTFRRIGKWQELVEGSRSLGDNQELLLGEDGKNYHLQAKQQEENRDSEVKWYSIELSMSIIMAVLSVVVWTW